MTLAATDGASRICGSRELLIALVSAPTRLLVARIGDQALGAPARSKRTTGNPETSGPMGKLLVPDAPQQESYFLLLYFLEIMPASASASMQRREMLPPADRMHSLSWGLSGL